MIMKTINRLLIPISIVLLASCTRNDQPYDPLTRMNNLFSNPSPGIETRWISPENPTGEKGKGGMTNKGAKGNAFFVVQPGESQVLMDASGPGMITRIWVSGTVAVNEEQRRAVKLEMYWDGSETPAVSAPFGDFFGIAHGKLVPFENQLFFSPEGRSFNCTLPMPFKKSAYIAIHNGSSSEVWIWYDINYLKISNLPEDILYLHASYHRDTSTVPGVDFEILPRVEGKGRFLGSNIGVMGGEAYRGTWFGEGEVKIYLDGDTDYPTLAGTGTEDYIGSGWGQGEYSGRYAGSLISDRENDIYAFYRFHLDDPVYFHKDIRVTIQQMGNANKNHILEMMKITDEIKPVWFLDQRSGKTKQGRLLDPGNQDLFESDDFPVTSTN